MLGRYGLGLSWIFFFLIIVSSAFGENEKLEQIKKCQTKSDVPFLITALSDQDIKVR